MARQAKGVSDSGFMHVKGIRKQLKGKSGTTLQDMDRAKRNGELRKLKNASISVRQTERLMGIHRGTVQNA